MAGYSGGVALDNGGYWNIVVYDSWFAVLDDNSQIAGAALISNIVCMETTYFREFDKGEKWDFKLKI